MYRKIKFGLVMWVIMAIERYLLPDQPSDPEKGMVRSVIGGMFWFIVLAPALIGLIGYMAIRYKIRSWKEDNSGP